MVNRVVLVGRLTKDPELRRTNNGTPVTSFTLAFTNRTKNADGSNSSSFVNCTAWNKTAEIVSQYCSKGSQLCVDGRLVETKFQRKDGTNASRVEIVVENKSPGITKEMAIVIATYMLISNKYLATLSDLKK